VLGISSSKSALVHLQKIIEEGYETIKIKVGNDFKNEFEILEAFRKNYPSLKIRIDCNQSWRFDEAISNLKALEPLHIEYCEEPLITEELHLLKNLKEKVEIKIAADESIGNKKIGTQVTTQNDYDVFVLKPMMIGSFSEIYVTKQLADSHYTDIVFTTSLESKIGRIVTAVLALGWGAKNYAHGLATGSLLSFDLNDDKEIDSGSFVIPKKPGIGIELNYKHLKEII
jgi:o-succinylbenzoate synthase